MVWLEYEERDTFIHRLNPLTKVILTGTFCVLSWFWFDVRLVILLILVTFSVSRIAKVPRSWYFPLYILIPTAIIYQITHPTAIFYATEEFFRVYPPEITQILLFVITPEGFPIFGYTALTVGGLLYMLRYILAPCILVFALSTFVYSTSITHLVESLRVLHVPEGINFMIVSIWRFIPLMERKLITILNAQTLRGLTLKTRNPITAVRKYMPLTHPITRYLVQQTNNITISVKSRGFGSKAKPTLLKGIKFSKADYAVTTLCVITFVLAVILLSLYNIGYM